MGVAMLSAIQKISFFPKKKAVKYYKLLEYIIS
jgi:hypothetical protein